MASKWTTNVRASKQGIYTKLVPGRNDVTLKGLQRQVSLSVGIPQRLIDNLLFETNQVRGGLSKTRAETFYAAAKDPEKRMDTRLSASAVEKLSHVVVSVAALHDAYYRGLLRSIDGLLASPGIPMTRSGVISRAVAMRVRNYRKDVGVNRNRNITLALDWAALKPFTKKAKRGLGPQAQVYWKHTGRLYATYHRHMLDQLSKLTLGSFTAQTDLSAERIQIAQYVSHRIKGEHYRRVTYTARFGIPYWDTVMDQVVTTPLITGQVPKLAHLIQEKGTGRFLQGTSVQGRLGGGEIYRIISPESRRPWLRQLSAKTHAELFKDIRALKKF